MKISVMLAYRPWFTHAEQLELAIQADRIGLDGVWIAESYGQDAPTMLGLLAGHTERVAIGSAIMQIPARQATTAAMAASTIDSISNGRFILGLGLSGPQVSEGWYGVPFTSPLGRTREYIEIIRHTLQRKAVDYQGTHYQIPSLEGGLGQGKPLRMAGGPVQDRIPIYLGVSGPKTVEQCGEIADGWLPFLFNPEDAESLTSSLMAGIEKAGRERSDVSVSPVVPCVVHEDIDAARELLRPILSMYLGGMGSKEKNFYVDLAVRYGHAESARACQDLFLAGDLKGAAAALTPGVIDDFSIVATPRTLERELDKFERNGVDELIVVPFGDRPALLNTLADAFDRRP